jgi:hypothetical protein
VTAIRPAIEEFKKTSGKSSVRWKSADSSTRLPRPSSEVIEALNEALDRRAGRLRL